MFSTDTRCLWEYDIAKLAVASQNHRCIFSNHKPLPCKRTGSALYTITRVIWIRSSMCLLFDLLFYNRLLYRIWLVLLFRMVIGSGIAVAFVVLTGIPYRIPSGRSIVMITLLSAIAPSASNINQVAILYGKDEKYASAINVLSTLSCILTMPFWILVYETLIS